MTGRWHKQLKNMWQGLGENPAETQKILLEKV
jgi:hypothetical protein